MSDSILPTPTASDLEQLEAARNAVVLLDGSDWGGLEVTGDDRVKFVNNFCTNDIKTLEPGNGREVFFCNVKGRILAHAWVFAFDGRLLILLEKSRVEFLSGHLDKYLIMEAAKIAPLSVSTAVLFQIGPKVKVGALQPLEHATSDVDGELTMINWGRFGLPGLMLVGEVSALGTMAEKQISNGAVPAGPRLAEFLRVSALLPKYGADISDAHLAQEANRTAQAISFTKGCYLGQEPIARLDAMGHVNRELVGIHLDTREDLAVGAKVLMEDGETQVGTVSSVATLEGLAETVALAMLKTKTSAEGTRVKAERPDGSTVDGTVFRNV